MRERPDDIEPLATYFLEDFRRRQHRHILSILAACGGNRAEAARRLGISRSTLKERLRRYRCGGDEGRHEAAR